MITVRVRLNDAALSFLSLSFRLPSLEDSTGVDNDTAFRFSGDDDDDGDDDEDKDEDDNNNKGDEDNVPGAWSGDRFTARRDARRTRF